MRLPRVRFTGRGLTVALFAACVVTGGGLMHPLSLKLARAADQNQSAARGQANPAVREDLPERWRRLRAEYLKIAAPMVEPLERTDRPRVTGLADLVLQTRKAEMTYQEAKLAREIAETDLNGYTEGTAKQERETAKQAIAAAEDALKRAETGLARARLVRQQINTKLDAKGDDLTTDDILARFNLDRTFESDELRHQRCKFALEEANLKQDVLTKFSQRIKELELKSNIEKRRSAELSCQSEWELAKSKEEQAKREESGPVLRPEEKKALATLADAVRSPGPKPPWDRGPIEFQAFLDKFEAKLAEARSLAERAGEARELERFLSMTARILGNQAAPGGD